MAGYSNQEICAWLYRAGVGMSVRQLKRWKKKLQIKRVQNVNNDLLARVLIEELDNSGRCLGYRAMHHRLVTRGIGISMHSVRLLLKELDPEGVESRRRHRLKRRLYKSKGPLYLVHVDGYDKLKPYGFAIHGAIDGFSRKVLWLRVGRSNNNPAVVAGYFVKFVEAEKGTARTIRVDAGTENVVIQDIQMAVMMTKDPEHLHQSFIIGRSVNNQRIERLWGILRKQCIQFWMDYFGDMVEIGLFNKYDELQSECLRFVFMDLVQKDLDRMRSEWNNHRLQRSRNAESPVGKPELIFSFPELYGAHSYKVGVSEVVLTQIKRFVHEEESTSEDHRNLFQNIMAIKDIQPPTNAETALDVYGQLLEALKA